MNEALYRQRVATKCKLIKLCILSFLFMVAELGGGLWSNSMAVISDGIHMGSDVIGYVVQLAASIMALQPSSKTYSFGKQRAELIGGLFNCFIIWTLTVYLIYMAVHRCAD